MLEAKLYGVGVLNRHGSVLLATETLTAPRIDGWAWLLREETYQRWLRLAHPLPSLDRFGTPPRPSGDSWILGGT